MTVDLYGLSWDNYRESITGSLRHLIRDEDFVDVSLHCEGRVLKAHKVQFCYKYYSNGWASKGSTTRADTLGPKNKRFRWLIILTLTWQCNCFTIKDRVILSLMKGKAIVIIWPYVVHAKKACFKFKI